MKLGFSSVLLICLFFNMNAQEGAKLFKQNCAACHKVDKNSIGPKLKGAKEKWNEAGEGDLLYEWIADPDGLYNSGKSKMAELIWDFNPTAMTPMAHLSKEEIDSIFEYVDKEDETLVEEEVIEEEQSSSQFNVDQAIVLVIILIFLLITVWVTGNAKTTLKKEIEKNKD